MKIEKVLWTDDDGKECAWFIYSKTSLAFAYYNLLVDFNNRQVENSYFKRWWSACRTAIGFSEYGIDWDSHEDESDVLLKLRLKADWRMLQEPVPSESEYSHREFASISAEHFANKCFEEMKKRGDIIIEE